MTISAPRHCGEAGARDSASTPVEIGDSGSDPLNPAARAGTGRTDRAAGSRSKQLAGGDPVAPVSVKVLNPQLAGGVAHGGP